MSYDRTYKQTNRDYYFICIDVSQKQENQKLWNRKTTVFDVVTKQIVFLVT